MKLLARNLDRATTEQEMKALFEAFGTVQSCDLVMDKVSGDSKGFGFVEMAESDADKAIAALNEKEFQQRTLKVRAAKQKPEVEAEAVTN